MSGSGGAIIPRDEDVQEHPAAGSGGMLLQMPGVAGQSRPDSKATSRRSSTYSQTKVTSSPMAENHSM